MSTQTQSMQDFSSELVDVPQVSDAESSWMTPQDLISKCKPGDLIEFYRGLYRHWAMYLDQEEYVFNVDAEDIRSTRARVSLRTLAEVANYGDQPRHRVVRINNKVKSAMKRGASARSNEEAIAAARQVLDTRVPYSFFNKNCYKLLIETREEMSCRFQEGEGAACSDDDRPQRKGCKNEKRCPAPESDSCPAPAPKKCPPCLKDNDNSCSVRPLSMEEDGCNNPEPSCAPKPPPCPSPCPPPEPVCPPPPCPPPEPVCPPPPCPPPSCPCPSKGSCG